MIACETLSLFATLQCDAKCDHCTVFGAPNRSERMPDDMMRRAIRQARAIGTIRMVAFTGGEPMLDYRRLRAMVAYVRDQGLQAGIVSNSSWALDPARAEARMAELAQLGLTTYITSLDEYHARYIDMAAVRNAVQAALAHRIGTHINALWTPHFAAQLARLPSLLGLPAEVVDGKGRHGVSVWMSVPAARRKVHARSASAPSALTDRRNAGPCGHILRHPVVAPDGSVHACCGVADTTPYGPARFSKVGTLQAASLRTLVQRMRGDLLFNLLARAGPNTLIERLREHDPSLPEPPSALNHCELCALLLQAPWRGPLAGYLGRLRAGESDVGSRAA